MRKPRARETVATTDELEKLITLSKPGLKLQILLCLDSAMRYSEALQVGPLNYNPEKHTAVVTIKGGRTAEIPISDRAANLIAFAQQIAQPGQSFVQALSGCNHPRTIGTQWSRLKRQIGIRRDLHIHDLRRTTATRAYLLTKDLRIVQQLLNHEAMSSTLAYLAPTDPQKLRPLIEAIQMPTGRRVQ